MAIEVPRINLKDYREGAPADRAKFIQTVGNGLKDIGFLNVTGHGLDPQLIENAYSLFREFFAMDESIKNKYDQVAGGARGYTPFGREHAKDTTIPDLKEFWHIGQELPAGHPYKPQYPDNIWPQELPDLKPTSVALYKAFEDCAATLLEAVALYFELPATTFSDMIQDGNSVFRIIHYPPLAPDTPPGAVRAAAHEDINLITLLIESKGGGLEILTQNGNWMPVGALAGDIIVDSGDMLSRVTNGIIPATTHRVVNPPQDKNESRYSMPFFVHPYSACDLTVLDRFVTEDRPPKWPPITAGEFLEQRLNEIGLKS